MVDYRLDFQRGYPCFCMTFLNFKGSRDLSPASSFARCGSRAKASAVSARLRRIGGGNSEPLNGSRVVLLRRRRTPAAPQLQMLAVQSPCVEATRGGFFYHSKAASACRTGVALAANDPVQRHAADELWNTPASKRLGALRGAVFLCAPPAHQTNGIIGVSPETE